MPRLAIHSAVWRSSRATDHSASNEPIITHTAHPISRAPVYGRSRSRSNARRCDASGESTASTIWRELRITNGRAATMAPAITRNGHGDAEAPDQQGGHGRAGGEAADVGGEQPPEVVPDAVGVGEDHDAPHGRHRHPDADAHHEATEQQREERAGEGEQHEPDDVDGDAGEHQLAGVAAVGERGDQHLGEEPGEEADADHRAEGALADPVLVADVVEHREQRPVAHRQQAEHEPERHEHGPAPGRTGRAHDRPR